MMARPRNIRAVLAALSSLLAFAPAACRGSRHRMDRDLEPSRYVVLFEPEFATQTPERIARFRRAMEARRWDEALSTAARVRSAPLPVLENGELVERSEFLIRAMADSPELLDRYRRRFDAEAAALPADRMGTQEWKDLFFCTGMDAKGDRLAQRWLDAGRPFRALEIWRLLAERFPDPAIPRPVLWGRALLAAAKAGEREFLERAWPAEGSVLVGSRKRTLAEYRILLLRETAELDGAAIPHAAPSPPIRPGEWAVTPLPRTRIEWAERFEEGRTWRAELRVNGRSVPLFRTPMQARPFLEFAVLALGPRILWCCWDGTAGVVDADMERQVWAGRIDRAPVPERMRLRAKGLVRSMTAGPRMSAAFSRRSSYSNRCVRGWRRAECRHAPRPPVLVLVTWACLWICPCGELTLRDLGNDSVTQWPGLEAAPLTEALRARVREALAAGR